LEGVGIQGEVSPNKVPNELNYLSLEYFASHPNASLEDFAEDLLKDFFGRKAPASRLHEYLRMNNAASMKKTLKEIREIQAHQTDKRVNERWQWLRDEIAQRYFAA